MRNLNTIFEAPIHAFLTEVEERSTVDESELEALAVEHDLEDDELAALRAELEAREVDPAHPLILGAREPEKGLVVVDRQAVVGDELCAQRARRRGIGAEQGDPGPRWRLHLCRQHLTRQVLLAIVIADSIIANTRRSFP